MDNRLHNDGTTRALTLACAIIASSTSFALAPTKVGAGR